MSLEISERSDHGKRILGLTGRFDFHSHRLFREVYERALEGKDDNAIELDLSAVEYMDSSALGMLLLFKEKASMVNKNISLMNCKGMVRQILEVANFHKLFAIK